MIGYLDTMKAFHKLFGNYYFFRRPAFNDLLLNFDLETIAGLETAARYYKMDRYRIYRAEEFIDELEERHSEMERLNPSARLDISSIPEISHQLKEGGGIPALVSLFMEQPGLRTGTLARTFPEMAAAARAVIELKHYRRM